MSLLSQSNEIQLVPTLTRKGSVIDFRRLVKVDCPRSKEEDRVQVDGAKPSARVIESRASLHSRTSPDI
jgi:hypothetical protein